MNDKNTEDEKLINQVHKIPFKFLLEQLRNSINIYLTHPNKRNEDSLTDNLIITLIRLYIIRLGKSVFLKTLKKYSLISLFENLKN